MLVDGDLKRREEVEEYFSKEMNWADLSQVMGDEELRMIACKGFADPLRSRKHKELANVK